MRFKNVNPGEHPEYIIVGLGNPGTRYDNTRHNVGFKVADYLDSTCLLGHGIKRMLHSSLCDKCVLDGYIIYLVKPQTYMNNSGMAVRDVMQYYRMTANTLIVIQDDTSLPVGEFKIKRGGSANGHNGIKSIIQHLPNSDFIRIRVGVGEVPDGWDKSKYVLSRFSDKELNAIEWLLPKIREAISMIFNYGLEESMEKYNKPRVRWD